MAERAPRSRHLGIDLGGTNIKWVVLDSADSWVVLDRGQVPTPAADGPDAVVARMASIGAEAFSRWPGVTTVGIGVPGSYDPVAGTTRLLTNVPGEWAGKRVAGTVGAALGLPARLINDARAFGLAELRLGAGRGASSMVGLVLGTGLGGVIALDGRIHEGHDGTAGEIGHQTIEPDGPACSCGSNGCLEIYVRADQISARCGTSSVEDAVARARAGDARAVAGMAAVGRYLGIGIANMVAVFTPDKVVMGGGGAAAFDLLEGPIRAELSHRINLSPLDQVELVTAELGIWAGAIGAALHGAESAAAGGAPAWRRRTT